LWTANVYEGGRTHRVPTPIDRIGIFLRPGAFVPVELARSLMPGDSMTNGRVKAALATGNSAEVKRHPGAVGLDYVIVYGGGAKHVIPASEF
jgi:alpha-glucosidase (family GH31 glycosyl hydrolase)